MNSIPPFSSIFSTPQTEIRAKVTRVLISGSRRGMTPRLIADLRRRSAIEPEIGHMKSDGRLARCPLKGTIGDAFFAVLWRNARKLVMP